jgi:hypothetical protein
VLTSVLPAPTQAEVEALADFLTRLDAQGAQALRTSRS